ncbi:translation initiation factor 6 [Methanolinea mesophila]|uniref:translation initiation factor IF-6 n=1 Tax=Methanolinea mesophila TaxID=547055 RepID=UPI001AE29C54|nr:translation initiation factor IF-6 [Methanolinea mesophila]MBP1929715.1 translation initiation factor 6 [Methanolinea mesophila]
MERTVSFAGDPNIGVFARAFDDIAVIPPEAPEDFRKALVETLKVELVETTIQGSTIIGSLLAGNRNGFVVSGLASDEEIGCLSRYRNVFLLEDTMNAAGNVILVNDVFCAVHPEMPRSLADEVGEFLKVPVVTLSLGGVKTVGMAAVATNRGVIAHPRSSRTEIQRIESVTDLPVGTGSVNMGSGLVGAGLLANQNGYVAGLATSGFELGRIEDVFGFI